MGCNSRASSREKSIEDLATRRTRRSPCHLMVKAQSLRFPRARPVCLSFPKIRSDCSELCTSVNWYALRSRSSAQLKKGAEWGCWCCPCLAECWMFLTVLISDTSHVRIGMYLCCICVFVPTDTMCYASLMVGSVDINYSGLIIPGLLNPRLTFCFFLFDRNMKKGLSWS